ncbi:MAG: hypothetical protein ACRDVE_18565, partial [Actinocrinis sp.]
MTSRTLHQDVSVRADVLVDVDVSTVPVFVAPPGPEAFIPGQTDAASGPGATSETVSEATSDAVSDVTQVAPQATEDALAALSDRDRAVLT